MLKLPEIHNLSTILFMYDYSNEKLPQVFNNFFENAENIHDHDTRTRSNIRVPLLKTKVGTAFIRKQGPTKWQAFVNQHGSETSKKVCKKIITDELVDRY